MFTSAAAAMSEHSVSWAKSNLTPVVAPSSVIGIIYFAHGGRSCQGEPHASTARRGCRSRTRAALRGHLRHLRHLRPIPDRRRLVGRGGRHRPGRYRRPDPDGAGNARAAGTMAGAAPQPHLDRRLRATRGCGRPGVLLQRRALPAGRRRPAAGIPRHRPRRRMDLAGAGPAPPAADRRRLGGGRGRAGLRAGPDRGGSARRGRRPLGTWRCGRAGRVLRARRGSTRPCRRWSWPAAGWPPAPECCCCSA